MYLPRHFEVTDPAPLRALIDTYPLGIWVMGSPTGLEVNHLPFLLDATRGPHGTLVGHVARANPAWRQAGPGVVVFQGAHGYVSPAWYATKATDPRVVPTWNYAVVHAHGVARAIEDPEALRRIVARLSDHHEAGRRLGPGGARWQLDDAPSDYIDKMLRAIVGIEFTIERLEGKFKLSQNRSAADREGVVAGLEAEAAAPPLVAAMRGAGATATTSAAVAAAAMTSAAAAAQDAATTRRWISSGSPYEAQIGYSRAVVDGDWVFVSGTTGFDYATMTIADDVAAQAEQCLRNIDAALREAGASVADVVRVRYLLPDGGDFAACWPVLRRWFGAAPPAATMCCAGLLDPRMKIEIEVTARRQRVDADAAGSPGSAPGPAPSGGRGA